MAGKVSASLTAAFLVDVFLFAITQVADLQWANTNALPLAFSWAVVPLSLLTLAAAIWAITRGRTARIIGILGCIAFVLPVLLLMLGAYLGSLPYS